MTILDKQTIPDAARAKVQPWIGHDDKVVGVLRHHSASYHVVSMDKKGRFNAVCVFKVKREWVVSADVQTGTVEEVFAAMAMRTSLIRKEPI